MEKLHNYELLNSHENLVFTSGEGLSFKSM